MAARMRMLEKKWWQQVFRDKTLIFWFGILILNFLLFLPHYLIDANNSTFIPLPYTEGRSFWLFEFLIIRQNFDAFRMCTEIFVLVSLMVFFRKYAAFWRILFILTLILYPIFLLYQLYEAFYFEAYNAEPLFYSDYLILEELIPLYFEDVLHWEAILYIVVGLIVFLLVVACILYVLSRLLLMTRYVVFGKNSYILYGTLFVFFLVTAIKYKFDIRHGKLGFQWITAKVVENIGCSLESYRWNQNYDPRTAVEAYHYEDVQLRQKPNVYLIAIESYGSLMMNDPYFQPKFDSALQIYQQRLTQKGWQAASAMSKAPVSGGRSWLSFTSVMCGIKIDNHGAFKMMLSSHPDYPNLMRFFKNQGYYNYRLHPVPNIGSEVPMDLYNQFYAFDRWIYYEDIEYVGDYYRWLLIPDQYVFNYALEEVVQMEGNEPFFFFFININSHYPWKLDRQPLYADWRVMNKPGIVGTYDQNKIKTDNWDHYFLFYRSIEYQLDYLTDYIARLDDGNSLFILFGDHQPPVFKTESFDTPVHIISKDTALIQSFMQYGLQPGLQIDTTKSRELHHEGMYSLFVRELKKNYGTDTLDLPPYFPEGITTD